MEKKEEPKYPRTEPHRIYPQEKRVEGDENEYSAGFAHHFVAMATQCFGSYAYMPRYKLWRCQHWLSFWNRKGLLL